ncbi:MAG: His/Gly/Thr/Pro-type tRNA ligase C-terminal domain-containing protein, partial [Anaerolineae bacterium]|nr:His/Gly/Thr/Pro-type tRNA ligase C-terminal domain-containing protein [Anaerolineae bacterium]
TESHNDYALQLKQRLREAGIRADADLSSDRMNAKIRQAQLMQVPYMPVIGDREIEEGTVALRKRDNSRQTLPVEEFIAATQDKIKARLGDL